MRSMKASALYLAAAACLFGGLLAAQNNKKNTSSPPAKQSTTAAKPAASTSSRSPGVASTGRASRTTATGPRIGAGSGGAAKPAGGTGPRIGSKPAIEPPRGGRDLSGNVHKNAVNLGESRVAARGINGKPAPRGAQPATLRNGSALQRRPDGRISDIHDARRGMDIHHGLNGTRRVMVERPDHSRIFAERGRPGFVQHPYSFRGHDFARRTYFYHGRVYQRFYRPAYFHGVAIEVYAPVHYYPVGFYGWVYNPWAHPIVFAWGWGPSPWVQYYGGYFAPYPAYPSAPYWLTDYMVSQDLAADYQAGQDAQTLGPPPPNAGAPELTPDVKQQIAAEVQEQLALENHEAVMNTMGQDQDPGSSGIARLLADGHSHAFVVGGDLDVVDASGAECPLSGGDVLSLNAAPAPDAQAADLVVLASKGGSECPRSDTVTVALSDLQDMQNHMRETIDQGLEELQAKQGAGGLPPAPSSAQAPPVETAFAQIAPPPDPNDGSQINQQLQQADAAETDVVQQAQQEGIQAPAPAPTQPLTISLGQTVDQVTSALGQPLRILNLGPKQIYVYQDMKITFNNGQVADVQ